MQPAPSAGKCARATSDWFWFCFSLAEKVARVFVNQSESKVKENQSTNANYFRSSLNWKLLYRTLITSYTFNNTENKNFGRDIRKSIGGTSKLDYGYWNWTGPTPLFPFALRRETVPKGHKYHSAHLFGWDIHGANVYLAIMSMHTSLISECSSHAASVSLEMVGEIDRWTVWGEGWLLMLPLWDLAAAKAGLSGLES